MPSVASRVVDGVRQRASSLVPQFRPGSLDDRDPDAIRERLPGVWLLANLWYRPELRGLHHLPRDGAALIVGNHAVSIRCCARP